jgi:hypothetical protein
MIAQYLFVVILMLLSFPMSLWPVAPSLRFDIALEEPLQQRLHLSKLP